MRARVDRPTPSLVRKHALVCRELEGQVKRVPLRAQLLLEVPGEHIELDLSAVVDAAVDNPRAGDVDPRACILHELSADARRIVAGAVLAHEDGGDVARRGRRDWSERRDLERRFLLFLMIVIVRFELVDFVDKLGNFFLEVEVEDRTSLDRGNEKRNRDDGKKKKKREGFHFFFSFSFWRRKKQNYCVD